MGKRLPIISNGSLATSTHHLHCLCKYRHSPHTCPFLVETKNDIETLCECCDYCISECSKEIEQCNCH
jgi:hypothetical protein